MTCMSHLCCPLLLPYCCAGAYKVQQEQTDGGIKDKHKTGFTHLGYRIVLGQHLLPDTLTQGV